MKRLLLPATLVASVMAAAVGLRAADIVVTTVNNVSPPAGQTSLFQALSTVQAGDTIKFNIPGDGPHVILTPIGGYPLVTVDNVTIDGYSQPGSQPNSNGILGGNDAIIKIVLDSSDPSEGNNPANPDLPLRRSTRLPYSGYGDSENAIIGVLAADGFKIRGIAFLGRHTDGSDADPSIYAIALVQEAKNAKVQGCWFGLKPGDEPLQENLKPCGSAVAAFRFRDAENNPFYSGGLVIGTDGDGTADVQEFNVILGCHIALAIEAPDLRVSGNYVNVFPNGTTFVDVDLVNADLQAVGRTGNDASVEFLENGRQADNTVIGTNGDNKSDGNERNIVAHTVYDVHIEFYSAATNVVIAGNYFGVGVDGVTLAAVPTANTPNFLSMPGTGSVRIGSNGDGVSDNVEGNLIYKVPGTRLVDAGATVPITARRNAMSENNFSAFPFADGENGTYEAYYAEALLDSASGAIPTITSITAGLMSGTLPAPNTANYAKHVVDVYVVDPKAAELGVNLPGTYAGSFVEGSSADQDAAANAFKVNLQGMSIQPGAQVAIAVTYTKADKGTPGTDSLTGPLSLPVVADIPIVVPGSVESVGLTRIVPDTPLVVPQNDKLGNWEPNASVLGTTTFLVEGNTFAEGFDAPAPDGKQRFVVALAPADGKAGKLVEGFYSDDFKPYAGPINASRQDGNPGRVAGDKRPGAVNYIVGGEASPHTVSPQFTSDNRWNLGFDRLVDGRYGTIQTFALDTATLVPTPLMKAVDSANGRLNSGAAAGNQITRFGGELACLDNGNFVSVIEDRSRTRFTDSDCAVATIFAPDGTVVKDTFVVAKGDIWSNLAAFKGGFAVRAKPQDGSNTRHIYLYDNAGNLLNTIPQNSSGVSFDTGRGDGTRIAGHINSPYLYLAGKVTDAQMVKLAAWDTRDPQRVTVFDVSEPAFIGNNDRVNLAVDALDRIVVAWDSSPDGYEAVQVAARIFALDGAAMTLSPVTSSFFPFINAAKSGGIRSTRMTVAMTTKQICVAAKGEINLQNKPDQGAFINPATGLPLSEINFYTVFSHPNPQDDLTTPAGGGGQPTLTATRSGNNLTISWTPAGGTLESKASLADANWTAVGTQNPATVAIEAGNRFYRVRK